MRILGSHRPDACSRWKRADTLSSAEQSRCGNQFCTERASCGHWRMRELRAATATSLGPADDCNHAQNPARKPQHCPDEGPKPAVTQRDVGKAVLYTAAAVLPGPTWLKASSRKPMFMPSTMGRRPVMAAPIPMPMKPFSARTASEPSGASSQHSLTGAAGATSKGRAANSQNCCDTILCTALRRYSLPCRR